MKRKLFAVVLNLIPVFGIAQVPQAKVDIVRKSLSTADTTTNRAPIDIAAIAYRKIVVTYTPTSIPNLPSAPMSVGSQMVVPVMKPMDIQPPPSSTLKSTTEVPDGPLLDLIEPDLSALVN